ncbi:heavy metal translocating P-type ATPase [Orbaceae bacterium ac157xtp]
MKKGEYQLNIEGMSCASCVNRVEKALKKVDNVTDVAVNLATEKANIIGENLDIATLIKAVEDAGYKAQYIDELKPQPIKPKKNSPLPIIISALLTIPLVLPMLLTPFGIYWMLPGYIQLIIATPIQFILGARFYRGAWKALKSLSGNMDLLVAIGTSSAYGLSCYLLITHWHSTTEPHLYFESSAVIITLILLGKYLEARAKHQTTEAIDALSALHPDNATIKQGEHTLTIPINQVKLDDLVIIKPGERIPVDGIVIEGISTSDESMLTGESLPITKNKGDKVTGGAINGEGLITVKTTALQADSMLSKIIQLVESAQAKKAPIQRIVDKISAVFVPVILTIALITLLAWGLIDHNWEQALLNAVAVIVIACPCALGLATPTSIMVGTGVAAKYGILIKDAEALETMHSIKAVAFDKTGTLTIGKPELTAFITKPESNHNNLLSIAATLQSGSEHPLAKAVIAKAKEEQIAFGQIQNLQNIAGSGLKAMINGEDYYLVSTTFMQNLNVDLSAWQADVNQLTQQGYTISWLAKRQTQKIEALALLGFADVIKDEAKQAISQLHHLNVKTVMISGDNQSAANQVAKQLDIDEVLAQVLPQDKANKIKQLQHQYGKVAMVGDGVNDAPALATADIGIAMGTGTDVAMHTSAITLMRGNLLLVADAIAISRRTYNKIKQNLFWAFIYNLIGVPLAAFGLLNPMLAGGAMALSSVSVVTNALLLKRWKGGDLR